MDFFNVDYFLQLASDYLPKVAGAILTLVIGFWIVGRITNGVERAMATRHVDATVRPFLGSMVSVGLKVMLLLAVAGMFGIQTTSFIAIFSAMAFAVGLALQGSLGHFASGVLLLTFRPYKVGDLVTIGGGQTGTVEGIQIFNTVLATLDNKRIIVPNGVVTSNVITNISGQGTIGVELTFTISGNESIDKARATILRIGQECPYILDSPAQGVVVANLTPNSVDLATRPFCNSADYWDTYFYMKEHVKKAFANEGLQAPMPHMTIQMPGEAK